MIDKRQVQEILDRADIVDVVREDLELKKQGANWVACCPFHNEKTPSFIVSPSRQTWHCFGGCQEGGDVIKFLQKIRNWSFVEAVMYLAKKYHIEIEEKKESQEEQEQRMKREAMLILNQKAAEFYAQQIRDEKNLVAWDYAVARFGEDHVRDAMIGYAPKGNQLYQWASEKGESIELLLEIGLLRRNEERGHIYDFYRERLMIPIFSRSHKIIGFTARDLSGKDGTAKYLNSENSEVYNKSTSIFGLDIAWREACKTGKFYCVEGAADAMKMHSVGILNVVAPLGGHWTKEQFQELRRATSSICFINDADRVPLGKKYGPGIAFVIKNGIEATKEGLSVTVRELPNKKDGEKQDPGEFFTGREKIDNLHETDFILWYAEKIYDKEAPSATRADTMRQIADVASYIKDDMVLQMNIQALQKYNKSKTFWLNAIEENRFNRTKKKEQAAQGVDLRQYGFYCEGHCYFGQTDKGRMQWSNFEMKPLFHIKDDESPRRLFEVTNAKGHKSIVEFTMEEMVSLSKFRQKLGGIGNYIWMASEREMIKLQAYLYDDTREAQRVKQMGWQSQGEFYAFGNGLWWNDEFHKADDYGICNLTEANWYIPSASKIYKSNTEAFSRERSFIYNDYARVNMGEYLDQFCQVFGDNGKIGLCYWVASMFRDIVVSHKSSFPILDLFGPKGTGKTQMAKALMAFFMPENDAPNLKNATLASLNAAVTFVSNALVHLDEYKNDIKADRIEMLKGIYDGVGRTKMGGAAYDKVIMSSVKTGVILSGQEMPTADIALFQRCIFLTFPKGTYSEDEKRRFQRLFEINRQGLMSVSVDILRWRKTFEMRYTGSYDKVTRDIMELLNNQEVETRIMTNWSIIIAAMHCLSDKISFPFSYEELLKIAVEMMRQQNRLSKTRNELSQFWVAVQYLFEEGKIFATADFKIKTQERFRSTTIKERIFAHPKKILYLNKNRIFQLYEISERQRGQNPLPSDSLKIYLQNAENYLGVVHSVSFASFVNGSQEMKAEGAKIVPVRKVLNAMAFDYDALADAYDINLERYGGYEDPQEGEPEEAVPAKEPDPLIPGFEPETM